MAHSIQEFRDKFVILNDLDIAAIIGLVNNVIIAKEPTDKFVPIALAWNDAIESAGSGSIDLNLDLLVQSDAEAKLVGDLMERVQAEASVFGPITPRVALQLDVLKDRFVFSDYPSKLLVEAAGAIKGLLT